MSNKNILLQRGVINALAAQFGVRFIGAPEPNPEIPNGSLSSRSEAHLTAMEAGSVICLLVAADQIDRILGADQDLVLGHEWGPAAFQISFALALLSILAEGFRLILVYYVQLYSHWFANVEESEALNADFIRKVAPFASLSSILFFIGFALLLFFPAVETTLYMDTFSNQSLLFLQIVAIGSTALFLLGVLYLMCVFGTPCGQSGISGQTNLPITGRTGSSFI